MTHICVGKLPIIGSDNGLSPEQRQVIIWTNAGILLIGPFGTNSSEILIEIRAFQLKKMHSKMSSAKCCSFRLGLNVLSDLSNVTPETNLKHTNEIESVSQWHIDTPVMYCMYWNIIEFVSEWNTGPYTNTFYTETYHQTSNISYTLLGNKIVDHSDVVGALPVSAAPTTSSFST